MFETFAAGDRLSHRALRSPEDLCAKVLSYYPQADVALIRRAYEFSEKAHTGQIRRSGEPYISHPLNVAGLLAELHLDLDTIVTGLLHDTVEDTHASVDQIRELFGDSIAVLVDGVTKISKMNFKTSTERQGENVRKMIVAMGKDVRVILVKLADRLHNMRSLHHMPFEKQERIALETLEIYCPLASRLGISSVKVELEDLAFRFYRPDRFYDLSQKVERTQREREQYIDDVRRLILTDLGKVGIREVEVQGRSKHLWSIYRKMQSRNIDYEQIYDVLAFRVIVGSISQCYEVLGQVHALWKPIPGRFKDFIAMPKANHYQSLHTTVIGPGGDRIEIQIRTREMHLIAERGIAAHWRYKERGAMDEASAQKFNWLQELVGWHQVKNPEEFLDTVKTDLAESEIYVFTPKGDVRELPEGATPIDFAFAIHTDVGNRCVGARVNGRMVPIRHVLQNGDTVEIITGPHQHPSKDWLKMCVTNRAKSKIRAYVKEEQRKQAAILGKELLDREFKRFGAAVGRFWKGDAMAELLKDFGIPEENEVLVRLGYGKLEPRVVLERLAPELLRDKDKSNANAEKSDEPSFLQRVVRSANQKAKKTGSLVSVGGMDDLLIHFAKCCNPIPGDAIVGFITRGRGVAVHCSNCRKAFDFDQMRKVDVSWTAREAPMEQARAVNVEVVSQDMPGLLKSMSETFAVQGMNIQSASVRTTRDRKAVASFQVSVRSTTQLSNVLLELQKIRGVLSVRRVAGD